MNNVGGGHPSRLRLRVVLCSPALNPVRSSLPEFDMCDLYSFLLIAVLTIPSIAHGQACVLESTGPPVVANPIFANTQQINIPVFFMSSQALEGSEA